MAKLVYTLVLVYLSLSDFFGLISLPSLKSFETRGNSSVEDPWLYQLAGDWGKGSKKSPGFSNNLVLKYYSLHQRGNIKFSKLVYFNLVILQIQLFTKNISGICV